MKRRQFLYQLSTLTTGLALSGQFSYGNDTGRYYMPDEGDPHLRTWMAFGASSEIWGKDLLHEVRRDLANLANLIAEYEPVSMLVRPEERSIAGMLLDSKVKLHETQMDDLWMRDTCAIFIKTDKGSKAAVDFNFNGWGQKQKHRLDAKIASYVADNAGVVLRQSDLVLEGGCIEVDGQGTAIITESCVLNKNRNPGWSKMAVEDVLMPTLGLDKIIWLPGIRGKDITDGHTDFYARFIRPGVVAVGYEPDPNSFDHEVTLEHMELLSGAHDARGQKLELIELEAPSYVNPNYESEDFAAGYIGFYVCNGAVILQSFGDSKADLRAYKALKKAYPDRAVEQLNIDAIAAGGGSIHCATHQEPV